MVVQSPICLPSYNPIRVQCVCVFPHRYYQCRLASRVSFCLTGENVKDTVNPYSPLLLMSPNFILHFLISNKWHLYTCCMSLSLDHLSPHPLYVAYLFHVLQDQAHM